MPDSNNAPSAIAGRLASAVSRRIAAIDRFSAGLLFVMVPVFAGTALISGPFGSSPAGPRTNAEDLSSDERAAVLRQLNAIDATAAPLETADAPLVFELPGPATTPPADIIAESPAAPAAGSQGPTSTPATPQATAAASPAASAPTPPASTVPPPSAVAPPPPPPPPPAPPPVSAGNPSGQAMPVGNLPGWTQVFTDDFLTNVARGQFPAALGDRWGSYPTGWRDTSGKGMYSGERTVSINNSVLDVWLRTEGGTPLVAALVPHLPGGKDQLYGRYAIRFRADPVPGYKTAWLLWPKSGVWPRDGEIDFPEGQLTGKIHAFMHRQNAATGSDQDGYSTNVTYADWHTAVIEWGPRACTFILDGVVIGRSTSRIPNTPMHWVIQTETSLGGPVPPTSASGRVQIDWVAVWRYTP